jgi:hypothetical protein
VDVRYAADTCAQEGEEEKTRQGKEVRFRSEDGLLALLRAQEGDEGGKRDAPMNVESQNVQIGMLIREKGEEKRKSQQAKRVREREADGGTHPR